MQAEKLGPKAMGRDAVSDEGARFEFGKNWSAFLSTIDERRVALAQRSFAELIRMPSLVGRRFLDVGCGSGLSSLVARRLGAEVLSFDYDAGSVATTQALKDRFAPGDSSWRIEQGSVLDADYLGRLGQWDIVYSWGVLHHTGAMWQAIDNTSALVAPGGRLAFALYNDQGRISEYWRRIKHGYVMHAWTRPFLVSLAFIWTWGWTMLVDVGHLHPGRTWREYGRERGMSARHDLIDWVGGYPFEVATPDAVFEFCRKRGFILDKLITRQGRGCNEFVFIRTEQPVAPAS
jgi:SAM-dependent methyltransferase